MEALNVLVSISNHTLNSDSLLINDLLNIQYTIENINSTSIAGTSTLFTFLFQ